VNRALPNGWETERVAEGIIRIMNVWLAALDDAGRPGVHRLHGAAIGHRVPPHPSEITVLP
jgi:hypothetical protein